MLAKIGERLGDVQVQVPPPGAAAAAAGGAPRPPAAAVPDIDNLFDAAKWVPAVLLPVQQQPHALVPAEPLSCTDVDGNHCQATVVVLCPSLHSKLRLVS